MSAIMINSMYDLEVMHIWDVQKKAFQCNITNTHNLPVAQLKNMVQVAMPSLEVKCADKDSEHYNMEPVRMHTTIADVAKEIYHGHIREMDGKRKGMSMIKLHTKVTSRIEEVFGVKFKYKMAFYAFGYKNEFIKMVDNNVGKLI